MYGVPAELDLSPFCGRELVQVCVGKNHIILRFDGDLEVSLECVISISNADQSELIDIQTSGPDAGRRLVRLVGSSVVEVEKDQAKIVLTFSDNCVLEIRDSNDSFESFQVRIGTQLVVV